jgi:hypothetical protein
LHGLQAPYFKLLSRDVLCWDADVSSLLDSIIKLSFTIQTAA